MSVDILHIINGFDIGGAERSLANLMGAGLSGDVGHGVVSLQDQGEYGNEIEQAEVPLWTLGVRRGSLSPTALTKLRAIVAAQRPKLLQGWMYHSNLAAALTRSLTSPKPLLAWNIRQTLDNLQQEKPLTRLVIRGHRPFAARVDAIVYNCALAQSQHEALGLRGKHNVVIGNGVDAQRFQPSIPYRTAMRQELGIPAAAPVICHAARYHPMKDHAGWLAAATQVASSDREVHFVLAGPGVDRDNADLVRQAAAIGEHRVHLLGPRNDMPRLLAGADVYCSSSAWGEGFPNVIVEAMACGVPCVATNVGASAEIIGDTGQVVAANAPEALATALIAHLQQSPEQRQRLGAAARQRVLAEYSIESAVTAYRALYARLLGN